MSGAEGRPSGGSSALTATRPSIADRERLRLFSSLMDATRAARDAGDHRLAAELAREGTERVLRLAPTERARIVRTLAGLLIEWSRDIGGSFDLTARHELLDRAYSWAMAAGDHRGAATAAAELASGHALKGRTAEAELWLDRARILVDGVGAPLPARARLADAQLRAQRLDVAGAIRIADDVLARVDHVDERDVFVATMHHIWSAELNPARLPELLAGLEALAVVRPWRPFATALLAYAQARLHLVARRPERALELLDPWSSTEIRPMILPHRAAAHLLLGDLSAAEIDAMEVPAAIDRWPRARTEMAALAALARLHQGDPETARERLRDAVARAEMHDFPIALTVLPRAELERLAAISYDRDRPEVLNRVTEATIGTSAWSPAPGRITGKEARLLRTLLAHPGLRTADLAARLGVSPNTVKTQLSALYRKVGVTSRAQLVQVARERLLP